MWFRCDKCGILYSWEASEGSDKMSISCPECGYSEWRAAVDITEKNSIKEKFFQHGIFSLWHITHRSNLQKILDHGILNYYDASDIEPNRIDISNPDAQRWRDVVEPRYRRRIHDYAALYIKPKNPMLYVRRSLRAHLCLLEIDISVLFESEYLITDGNAASGTTRFYNSAEHLEELPWAVLTSGYWPDHKDGKRKMCAEVLVYPKIDPVYISALHFYSVNTRPCLADCNRKMMISPELFF